MANEHNFCYCLAARRSARALSRMYDRHLAPAGINIQQMSILSIIRWNNGISIAELTEEMAMERTTLLRALRPLQEGGLILSETVGSKKSLAMRISARGRQTLSKAAGYWRAAQLEFEGSFGEKRAVRLRDELREAV